MSARRLERGVVYVEAIIAIPVLILFFSLSVQLAYLSIASLLVKHAAVVAARAAAVILPDCPSAFADGSPVNAITGSRLEAVTSSAMRVLATLDNLPLLWPSGSAGVTANDVLVDPELLARGTAIVSLRAPCSVPLGGWMACGGKTATLWASATFPTQVAGYAWF